VVDPSLLRQAADRGVTIAFADLDGADGLWVPEERTVLVNRGLSDAKVAEVIEHELTHVAIDDQHADLDAGREVMVGRPPIARSGPLAVAAAGVAILAVVGGVAYGIDQVASRDRGDQVVGPVPPGLTAEESGGPRPSTTIVVTRDAQGRVITRTITVTASPEEVRLSASALAPSTTPAPPARTAARTTTATGSVAPPPTTPPVLVTTQAPVTTTAAPTPTEVPTTATAPATTAAADPGEGEVDQGDAATEAGTETLADTGSAPDAFTASPAITSGN
jgi:hypothetical protein